MKLKELKIKNDDPLIFIKSLEEYFSKLVN